MQHDPANRRTGSDWRPKVLRQPLTTSAVVIAVMALVAVLLPAGALATSLTGNPPLANPVVPGTWNLPLGALSPPASSTTTTLPNPITPQPVTTPTVTVPTVPTITVPTVPSPTTTTSTTAPTGVGTSTTAPTTTNPTGPTTTTTQPATSSPPAGTGGASATATARAARTRDCLPDPSATIDALPAGGVWDGGGKCYLLSNAGIDIIRPVTIENASFHNPQQLVQDAPKRDFMHPFILVGATSGVTLTNLVLTGENARPVYHGRPWVAQEGIKLNSSHDVTITNVTTNNTFGDGLIFSQASGRGPCRRVTVTNYTVNVSGRQGVTMGSVVDSTLTNVHIGPTAQSGWDFESDSAAGAGNITINNASGGGAHMNEPLFGAITFNNSHIDGGHVWMLRDTAASRQPVIFNGGTILLPIYDNGSPPAGITVAGPGNLTFNNVRIGNVPAYVKPRGASWNATGGAHITFNNSTPTGPAGSHDAISTVTFGK